MSWIQTYTGKQFWPLEPERNEYDIEDIAHSLSLLCRFNGHCREFYSVAEHCVRASKLLPKESAIWGLMHDAGEAYLVDMPKPLKRLIPEFEHYENNLLEKIAESFGLSWPIPKDVHHADVVMLMTEKRDLMVPEPASWGIDVEPLPERIQPLPPQEAKEAFLARFYELMEG